MFSMRCVRSCLRSTTRAPQAGFSSAAGPVASKLTITKTQNPQPVPDADTLTFGHQFTDHMLECDWSKESGWGAPSISPFHDLSIHPAASSLHYALQCFEGMKAYVDDNGRARLFRPDMNMKRMNNSMKRLYMPAFDGPEYLECIKKLVLTDKRFIPHRFGFSLYIRPTAISTTPWLGVGPPQNVKLFTILSPVGPYYPGGFKPVSLYADPKNVRAWPGGVGNIKCGGNYAMSIQPQMDALGKKCDQVLWLFGDEQEVTEVGTMNIFFLIKTESGDVELLTAPLDGTILPGVTRDSVLSLCRQWGEFKVTERKYSILEVVEASKAGRLIEAFGSGTAAIVSPVSRISYDGKDYEVPLNKEKGAGDLTSRIADTLMGIQYGKVDHEWSVVLD